MLFTIIIDNHTEVKIDLFNEVRKHEINCEKVLTVTFGFIRRERTRQDETEHNGVRIRVCWFDNYVAGLLVASPCTK